MLPKYFLLSVLCQLIYLVTSARVPQNPCPDVFSYYKNSRGDFYGEAIVPYDGSPRLTFSVNASFASLFEKKNLKLELANPPRDPSVRTLKYYIYFPFNNVLPKITQIMYNDRVYCSGPPEPLIPGGQGVTNVWSAHMYQYYTGYSPSNYPTQYNPPTHIDSNEDDDNSSDDIPVKDPELNSVQGSGRPNPTPSPPRTRPTATRANPTPTKPKPTQTEPTPVIVPKPSSTSSESVDIDYDIFKPASSKPSLDLTPTDILSLGDIQCGVPTSGGVIPLILGGTKTEKGQYPWLAAYYVYDEKIDTYSYRCTANLISQKHVITAAQCVGQFYGVQLIKTEDILIVMGTNDLKHWATNGAITRGASKVVVNPGFMDNSKSANADIAIITMKEHVAYTNTIRPICLWNTSDSIDLLIDKKGMLAGWGAEDEKSTSQGHTPESKYVELPIVSHFECLKADPGYRNITSENTFCAGDKSGRGPCVGDSGAGFVLPMQGAYYIRGIASFTLTVNGRCPLREKYAVFCDLAKYKRWIEGVMIS